MRRGSRPVCGRGTQFSYPADMSDPRALLHKEAALLVQRLRSWTPTRWAADCAPWGTRADLARHLAQAWADTCARLEGEPHRALPVLAVDLLVADQLAVTADDLWRADPDEDVCLDAVGHLLLHRRDLLGEDVPASLGGEHTLERGQKVCTG